MLETILLGEYTVKEKVKARASVAHHLRVGKLLKEPCDVCGGKFVEAHHPTYAEPLTILWLCPTHHKMLHKSIKLLTF